MRAEMITILNVPKFKKIGPQENTTITDLHVSLFLFRSFSLSSHPE